MICPYMSYRSGSEEYMKTPFVDCQGRNCGCYSALRNKCGLIKD